MPTRRIPDSELSPWARRCLRPCRSPDHDPPSHMVYRPGTYEHTCSGCGRTFRFTVPAVTCSAGTMGSSLWIRGGHEASADALDDAWAHTPGRAVTMKSRVDAARKRARAALESL